MILNYSSLLLVISLSCAMAFAQKCPDSCEYYIPKAATPDSDPSSDILEVISTCSFTEFEFTLIDRWGEQTFHSTDPNMEFDTNVVQRTDVYTWKLTATFCNSKKIEDVGQITILP